MTAAAANKNKDAEEQPVAADDADSAEGNDAMDTGSQGQDVPSSPEEFDCGLACPTFTEWAKVSRCDKQNIIQFSQCLVLGETEMIASPVASVARRRLRGYSASSLAA